MMGYFKMEKMCLFVTLTLFSVMSVFGANFNHTYKVLEEQPAGTVLGKTVAVDTNLYLLFNQEELQRLRFSFTSKGNVAEQMFAINESTSQLRTIKKIDREEECQDQQECKFLFDVMVYIRDINTNLDDIHSIVRLTVDIEDINDNPPEFESANMSLTVPESIAVNQKLIISPAYDLDTGANNSVQSYMMIPNEGIFEVRIVENVGGNSDLEIVIKKPLNREQRENYNFMIVAKDGGNPPRSGSVAVNIQVTDVNDNTPLFKNRTFEVTVSENVPLRTTILKLEAKDNDADLNGAMLFSFTSENKYFSINEQTGEIYPIRELDYEDEVKYVFGVLVRDRGSTPRSSQAQVTINIADVNDNAPQIIVKDAGNGKVVSEDAEIDSFIDNFNVLDADSNENGEVECTVSDDHFRVEKFTFQYYKIHLNKALDYEDTKTYVITITCTDKGLVPMSNSTSFTVKVRDENDNAPVFQFKNYTGYITENNEPDQLIMSVTAVDIDGTGNNEVSYAIIEDSTDFIYINTDNGEIRAMKTINREEFSSFRFKVEARDNGSPAKSSFAMVTIVVDDVNDEAPKFSRPHFEIEFAEERKINSLVGKLTAEDKDASPRFLYSLIDDDVADVFSISSATGEIISLQKLDRMVKNKYDFSVMVRDAEVLSFNDTAMVTVYVTEDRSVPPTILYPIKGNNSVKIPLDAAIGYTILFVRAENMESADRKVRFLIEHGNEDNFFQLDENFGNLTIAKKPKDAGKYKLLISSYYESNPGQKSFVTLDITIMASMTAEDDTKGYIVIVVVIVCVTFVLAGAILLAICMMKRVDRERRNGQKRRKEEMEKVYHVDKIETKGEPSNWDKEDNLHVMVKPKLSFKEEKSTENTIQRDKTDGISPTAIPKKIVQFADHPVIKVEDDVSNLSAEADSGHGGSEEDFNGNGRYLFLHADSASSQQLSPCESFDFRPDTSILSNSSLREWLVETPRRVPLPCGPGNFHKRYSPVPDNYHTEQETSHIDNYSTHKNPPSRKTSSQGSQKSVRFSVEEPIDDSDI